MRVNDNFGFKHKCGILLHVSSLPSRFGIGSFGTEAFDFIDFLAETRQRCWQVLPLNPTSYGDSPYQSPASLAGNPYFISLELLHKEGLLSAGELEEAVFLGERVDYGFLFQTRFKVLRKAHARFVPSRAFSAFCKKNADWLEDYALFMALKEKNAYSPWYEWGDFSDVGFAREHAEEFTVDCNFWKWVQFAFSSQWGKVLEYAHSTGVSVIGDMPIYVAHDSADVWCAPEQFLLDSAFSPVLVAGCPPDGFSPDGQLWGNPIYNWEKMRSDNFKWWKARVGRAFELFDILRIDHFRGFASFYAVPFGDDTARRGEWLPALGSELFASIREAFPKAKIIAEDLGFITEDVRELLKETGFPGMKNLQFAFFDEDSEFLPRIYTTDNCVVYTASHDADCTESWFKDLSGETKKRFRKECPRKKGQSGTYALIAFAMNSLANLAMVPMQDYLRLENHEARMNVPSVPDGNWQWRMKKNYNRKSVRDRILSLCRETGRSAR